MYHAKPFSRVPLSNVIGLSFQAKSRRSGPDRRLPPRPETDRGSQLREIDVTHRREDVARVDEHDAAKRLPLPDRKAQFGVEDDQPVAAVRHAVLVQDAGRAELVEREPPHGGVATGEEPLGGGNLLVDLGHRAVGLPRPPGGIRWPDPAWRRRRPPPRRVSAPACRRRPARSPSRIRLPSRWRARRASRRTRAACPASGRTRRRACCGRSTPRRPTGGPEETACRRRARSRDRCAR